MDLIVNVKEIRGTCPVYKLGDTIVVRKGYVLDTRDSSNVCMHSLASLMPYYVALSKGVHPGELGLSGKRQGCAYLQCLDPCEITGGGTVVFEVSVKEQ
ncbi:MAG: TIGR04076 family protein [Desulfobacterales bacterium]|nr:TIGR04076 family protein [Desulfobacterales bacterium]